MTQQDIDEAVATATGESVDLISSLGFEIADPLDVRFDPEPRKPLVLDWDTMSAIEWAEW
jgi:hypothetical protein